MHPIEFQREDSVTEFIQVMTTAQTKGDAHNIARAVTERRLAACAQIVGPISSTYWWQDALETAEEWLCLIKSRKDLYQDLEKAIRQVHPYDVPEILATRVVAGDQRYLDWLNDELKGGA